MNVRPTIPVQPWEIPAKVPDDWTRRPTEAEIEASATHHGQFGRTE